MDSLSIISKGSSKSKSKDPAKVLKKCLKEAAGLSAQDQIGHFRKAMDKAAAAKNFELHKLLEAELAKVPGFVPSNPLLGGFGPGMVTAPFGGGLGGGPRLCVQYQEPLNLFYESCEEPICYKATILGPHNT